MSIPRMLTEDISFLDADMPYQKIKDVISNNQILSLGTTISASLV